MPLIYSVQYVRVTSNSKYPKESGMTYLTFIRSPCLFILFFYLTFAGNLPHTFAGEVAKKGDNVSIEYEGSLDGRTVFDSSKKHGEPLEFIVGSGRVIPGFDKAVTGMKVMEEKSLPFIHQRPMVKETKSSLITCCALGFLLNQNPSQEWDS